MRSVPIAYVADLALIMGFTTAELDVHAEKELRARLKAVGKLVGQWTSHFVISISAAKRTSGSKGERQKVGQGLPLLSQYRLPLL